LERCLGIADNAEIHVVELGLLQEGLPFLACNGRQWTLFDSRGAVSEALQHCIDIE
jgi:hypothetical protein